jgi:hypothetical protein
MDRYGGPHTDITIALYGALYISNIMDRYGGPNTALTLALHGDLFLPIIIDRYRGHHTALTIALNGGLYNGTLCYYYSLAWRPLPTHYNGPLLRTPHCP